LHYSLLLVYIFKDLVKLTSGLMLISTCYSFRFLRANLPYLYQDLC